MFFKIGREEVPHLFLNIERDYCYNFIYVGLRQLFFVSPDIFNYIVVYACVIHPLDEFVLFLFLKRDMFRV